MKRLDCSVVVKVKVTGKVRNSSELHLNDISSTAEPSVTEVPAGSPSRGGDVTVHVTDINRPSLPPPFLFCTCVYFCLYGPFNRISFHKFSRQLSAFSLCSSGLISVLLVLSAVCLFMSLPQPRYNPLWLTELKAPTTYLLCLCLVHRYFDIAFIPSV